ncbi:MAG: glycosyltransferase family 25 protein [Akkermansia muciniphila]|nr:glycosyltransferase family 25 protein [Akkermansia muciniphila]
MNEQKDPLADLGVILYYINLDRDTARRDDMEQQAREQGVVLHRIPGVFGADLKPEDLRSYDDKRRKRLSTASLGKGELGCLLSHVKAINAFLASDAEYAVIFEDDAVILPEFSDKLRYIIEHSSGWGYVKLYSDPTKMYETDLSPEGAEVKLAFHKKLPWKAVAYMLTTEAARTLLNLFNKSYWLPYDAQLAYFLMRYDIPAPGVMENIVSTHFPFNEESSINAIEDRRVPEACNQKKCCICKSLVRYLNYRWHTWTMSYLKLRGRRTLRKHLQFH